MSEKVISMSKKASNGVMMSPEDALRDALSCIRKDGAFEKGKKLIVLAVDDTDGDYSVSFIQAGMTMSQCIALCEVAKSIFLSEMNY